LRLEGRVELLERADAERDGRGVQGLGAGGRNLAGAPERRPSPARSFVTQLFACEARLEAFRRHRRAGPELASASYEDSEHLEPGSPRRFERVL
jgi:hypothetical protein